MKRKVAILLCFLLAVTISSTSIYSRQTRTEKPKDWKKDWAVQDGFELSKDAGQFHFPSAITFIPNPGSAPKDPLYFVTELRGKVKVVTNDRSIYTFADLSEDFFNFQPRQELPSGQGQGGLAGICLAPEQGYVFATFLYRDAEGHLRNNIVRYESAPGEFSRKAKGKKYFTDLFTHGKSGLAHHIGSCRIHAGQLYVSVGEAWQPFLVQDLDNFFGKVLRLTLDGEPVSDNPFGRENEAVSAPDYIWAYGMRNPFSLEIVRNRVFVADNGPRVDRFMEIEQGQNYLYDGSDQSIATNADFVWHSSVGPVQMDYLSSETALFPESYRQAFYVALSALSGGGIYRLAYDFERDGMAEVPGYFVRYTGEIRRRVTGLAFGPDGLYFTAMDPTGDQRSHIFKVEHTGEASGHLEALRSRSPLTLMKEKGCLGCHTVDGAWGYGGATGPPLYRGERLVNRVLHRVGPDSYKAVLEDQLAAAEDSARIAFIRKAKDDILSAEEVKRVRVWLEYFLQEPGFDRPYNPQMPDLDLSSGEARSIAEYLVADAGNQSIAASAVDMVPDRIIRFLKRGLSQPAGLVQVILFFVGGIVTGVMALSLFLSLRNSSIGEDIREDP